MFVITVRKLGPTGQSEDEFQLAASFVERKHAVEYLDTLLARYAPRQRQAGSRYDPDADWDIRQDIWWIRIDGKITHYTIDVDLES